MNYREIPPSHDLRSVIRFFWTIGMDSAQSDTSGFRIVADGCPGIIFTDGTAGFAPEYGKPHVLPHLFLYGQTTRPGMMHPDGTKHTIGINLYPHALQTLFGIDADELTDQIMDIDLLFPGLTEQLFYTGTTEQRIRLLTSSIVKRFKKQDSMDGKILHSIRHINKTKGNVPVQMLYKDLHLSERQFQRRFKQQVGIPPKLYSRIIRFQSALLQVRYGHFHNLSEVAFENGYADQSHFIRDFREFTGLKPGSYNSLRTTLLCRHDQLDPARS